MLTQFNHTRFQGGAGAHASSSAQRLPSIYDYQDQNILVKLITEHENYFMEQKLGHALGHFNGHQVLVAQDGHTHFQATNFIVANSQYIQGQSISKTLIDWVENMLAFHLLKNIALPDQLSTLIPINILNAHWVALNADFRLGDEGKNLFEIMQACYATREDKDPVYVDGASIDYIDLNQAKNFVHQFLEDQTNGHMPFMNIQLTHYDSMNAGHNNDLVMDLLADFADHYPEDIQIGYDFKKSVQQLGNTCCEFTVANGMAHGLYNSPVLEFDSTSAREFSELLKSPGYDKALAQYLFSELNQSFIHTINTKAYTL